MSPLPIVGAIILCGLVVQWMMYLRLCDFRNLRDNGQDSEAAVTKLRHTTRTTDIRYSFRLPTGEELESHYENLPVFLSGVKVGDKVRIRYLPEKPKVNYFADNMERKLLSMKVSFIMPVFCVMIICLPLLMATAK